MGFMPGFCRDLQEALPEPKGEELPKEPGGDNLPKEPPMMMPNVEDN